MKIFCLLSLLLLGCAAETDTGSTDSGSTETERSTLENTGYACIESDDDDNHDTARVTVVLSSCLESCAMDPQATCEATTSGSVVTVTASGSYSFVPEGEDCATKCVAMEASCEADGVANGDFSLEYAEASVDFSGPVDEASCTGP